MTSIEESLAALHAAQSSLSELPTDDTVVEHPRADRAQLPGLDIASNRSKETAESQLFPYFELFLKQQLPVVFYRCQTKQPMPLIRIRSEDTSMKT